MLFGFGATTLVLFAFGASAPLPFHMLHCFPRTAAGGRRDRESPPFRNFEIAPQQQATTINPHSTVVNGDISAAKCGQVFVTSTRRRLGSQGKASAQEGGDDYDDDDDDYDGREGRRRPQQR
jgi:hypothetical protein